MAATDASVDTFSSVFAALVVDDVVVPFDAGKPNIFPVRYGASADPVVLTFGAKRLPELQQLVKFGGDGKPRPVKLVVKSPRRRGRAQEFVTHTRSGLIIQSVEGIDNTLCRVQIVDKRWDLTRQICPCDFNVVVGTDANGEAKYQEDTVKVSGSACTVEEALQILDSALGTKLAQLVSAIGLRDAQLPDNMLFSGRMTLADTIDYILSHAGLAMTVDKHGEFVASYTGEGFAISGEYGWAQQPDLSANVAIAPAKVIVPYVKRVELKAVLNRVSGTRRPDFGSSPELWLEQVYGFRGKFYTATELAELYAAAYGNRGTNIADIEDAINSSFESTAWVGTLFQTTTKDSTPSEGIAAKNAAEFVAAIRRDYRVLFRFVASEQGEALLNSVSDFAFGVFDDLGRVVDFNESKARGGEAAGTVKAEYAVFKNEAINGLAFTGGQESAYAEKYSFRFAPFNVRWERTPMERVIRLELKSNGGEPNWGRIGNLITIPTIRFVTTVDTQNADPGSTNAFTQRLETHQEAVMDYGANLEVSMVATLNTPNTLDRFHKETRKGVGSGEPHYLGVDPSIYAAILPNGTLLNVDAIETNADSRSDAYLQQFRYAQAASGLAHGVKLMEDVGHPQGNLVELAIEFSTRGRAFVGTRAIWGKPTGYRSRSQLGTIARRSQVMDVAGQKVQST